jgi:hypothetical protein
MRAREAVFEIRTTQEAGVTERPDAAGVKRPGKEDFQAAAAGAR